MKCFCNTPGLGFKYCPTHHPTGSTTRRIGRTIISTPKIPYRRDIKNKIIDETINLTWSEQELNAMSFIELWVVALMLKLPHRAPNDIHQKIPAVDLIRHIKAYLGLYNEEAMEKYRKSYTHLISILPRNN